VPERTQEASPRTDTGGSGARTPQISPQRAEQRAETMRVLRRMAELPPGDPERERLRAEVIEDHMPFARHIAQRYGGHGAAAEDFVQVAYVGLVKAVDNFDPDYGTGFPGYATPMIIGEIKRYFRDATWDVHVPRRMQELSGSLRKATDILTLKLGREPTRAEVADYVGLDVDEVQEIMRVSQWPVSLETPLGEEDDVHLGDLIPDQQAVAPADAAHRQILREEMEDLLDQLDQRERRVLELRYGFQDGRERTLEEVGRVFGVTRERIRQIEAQALIRLRESTSVRRLKDYLE